MRRLLALLRAGLRQNFGLALLKNKIFKQRKDLWLVLLAGLGFLGLLPVIWLYFTGLRYAFAILKPMGQETALLTLAILAGQFLILVFGLFYVLSAFYFSRDLEFLVSLPARPFEVIGAKFGVILVNEYLTVLFIVAPAFIVYGVMAGKPAGYWPLAAGVFLLLPVIPLALSGLLVMLMMRLVNVSRKKDFLILAGSLTLLTAVLFLQLGLAGSRSPEELVKFFSAADGLARLVGEKFPPCIWASRLMAEGFSAHGIGYLALYAGLSFGVLLLLLLAAEKLFYRGLIGLSEMAVRRKKLSRGALAGRLAKGGGAWQAILRREWKLMNRTPIFLLNGILSVILIPVMLFFMARSNAISSSLAMLKVLGSGERTGEILFAAAFFVACGCLNGTASSTFSREGRNFWISKVIPVAPGLQLLGKFLHSYLVAGLGVLGGSLVAWLALGLDWKSIVPAALLALVSGVLLTAVNMAVDLARPLLNWTNPMRAIKQNLNVVLAMALDAGVFFGLYHLSQFLRRSGIKGTALIVTLFTVISVLAAAAFFLLARFADKRYMTIEI
jgi:ABC-2 type transport system permease protein